MCQILSLFKIEFRHNKINFAVKDRRWKNGERRAEIEFENVKM
jgi:hypothetical protein